MKADLILPRLERDPTSELHELPQLQRIIPRMYAQHFGLSGEAFSLTPDPSFLYLSPGHSEALAAIELGLRERRGLIVMTGEVGTGKTTLLYSILSQLGAEMRTAYILNTSLSFEDILRQALADFGVPSSGGKLELLTNLNTFLLRCATDAVTATLVIDEAQNLDRDTLENLRLLLNYETYTTKLLQILLVGQPELDTKLSNPNLRQVAERVAVRCHVNPLTGTESRRYVEHRLKAVGGSTRLFSPLALRVLLRNSGGIPRRINILCHNALLFTYGRGARRVSSSIARAAVRAREGRGLITSAPPPEPALPLRRPWLRPALAAAAVVLASFGAVAAVRWPAVPMRRRVVASASAPQSNELDVRGRSAALAFATTLSVETSFAGTPTFPRQALRSPTRLLVETSFGGAPVAGSTGAALPRF